MFLHVSSVILTPHISQHTASWPFVWELVTSLLQKCSSRNKLKGRLCYSLAKRRLWTSALLDPWGCWTGLWLTSLAAGSASCSSLVFFSTLHICKIQNNWQNIAKFHWFLAECYKLREAKPQSWTQFTIAALARKGQQTRQMRCQLSTHVFSHWQFSITSITADLDTI